MTVVAQSRWPRKKETMEEQKAKAKRKYTRRQSQPEVYSVLVRVTRGRRVETIHCESTRVENGCLVVVSMDGPPPLVEKTRYIPFGSAEIEVCARPQAVTTWTQPAYIQQATLPMGGFTVPTATAGPQIEAGPLGRARMVGVQPRPQSTDLVERNAEGAPVVSVTYLDGSPT
jgi:hypothetical protein